MCRAVERHVLDEVSQPQLLVGLQDRAGIHDKAQLSALFRLQIPADVVANAVRQGADANFWIDRQRRGERRHGGERRRLCDLCWQGDGQEREERQRITFLHDELRKGPDWKTMSPEV